ncbi:MAG: hypothetical protein GYB67_13845 [Chloroflexi bacterium]|nr:hypothetical protein [Chloroflexota bacterium]
MARRFALLFGLVMGVAALVPANAQTIPYTTIDGRISFEIPFGWTVFEEYASIIVTDTDTNTLRGGLLTSAQINGADVLYEQITGEAVTADLILQMFAGGLPEIRANMEAELGTALGLPDAVYTGPVEIAGYSGATGFFGAAPIYAFDVPDGILLMSLNGESVDEMVVVLETMLETLTVSPFSFDASVYTTPITADNVATLSLVTQYALPGSTVRDFALLPGSDAFFVVNSGTARLVEMTSGAILRSYDLGDLRVRSIALSPDGKVLAAGSGLGPEGERIAATIRLFDVGTGETLRTIVADERAPVEEVGFSPDGSLLAVNAGVLLIYDAATGNPATAPDRARDNFAFSPDGTQIAANCLQQNYVLCLYDLDTGEIAVPLPDDEDAFPIRYESVAFSPDGSAVLVGFIDYDRGSSADLTLWSAESGELIAVASGPAGDFGRTTHRNTVEWITFSPDGTLVATVSDDESLRLWEAATANGLFVQPDAHPTRINRVAFSPDGTLIFTAADDGIVRIWAVSSSG